MDDLRRRLERLSDRGTPRGAGPVLARARTSAIAGVARGRRLIPAIAAGAALVLIAGAAGALVDRDGDARHGTERQLAAPATSTTTAPPTTTPIAASPPITLDSKVIALSRLQSFGSCSGVLSFARKKAMEVVGPYGLPYAGSFVPPVPVPVRRPSPPTPAPPNPDGTTGGTPMAAALSDAAVVEEHSTTNIQEPGVDEPDTVKTDGHRLFTLAQGRLWAVAVDGTPRMLGSLPVENGQQLLLSGDRVLVLGNTVPQYPRSSPGAAVPASARALPPTSSRITVVDASKPGAMRVTGALDVDGGYLSARLIDGVARVVFASAPHGLPFAVPESDAPEAQKQALARNRAVVRSSTVDNWLPGFRLLDAGGQPRKSGRLVAFDAAYHPPGFSGFGTLGVLTLDAERPERSSSSSVMADGEIIYASTQNLYVATNQWAKVDGSSALASVKSLVHKFDITNPTGARYLVSGEVRGTVLNQFSLSEHRGHLRVATTDSLPSNESFVTVLKDNGQILTPVGQVGGLGKGQRIFAARFMGDVAYVVTFLQVDPLYIVDLSNPSKPRVVGALELEGFSYYLHPVGPGLLLGVGQHVGGDPAKNGLAVSLFDVSKPAVPRLLQQRLFGPGTAQVERDHHAFLWWAPSKLVVLPAGLYEQPDPFWGALGMTVTPGAIGDVGRIQHPKPGEWWYPVPRIERAVVVGDAVLTVSSAGVMSNDLHTFATRAWAPFG